MTDHRIDAALIGLFQPRMDEDEVSIGPNVVPPTLRTTSAAPIALTTGEMSEDAVRLLMGLDPAREGEPEPVFAMTTEVVHPPVDPPYKRKGLTGKRYRIARRGYARTMRRWERGLIPGRLVRTTANVRLRDVVKVRPGEYSVGFEVAPFRGQEPRWFALDETDS